MSERLQNIFGMKKVTFNRPAESHIPGALDSKEQETIFIEVQSSKNVIKDKKQIARVQGKLTIFCNNEKLPYGYFSKRINEAPYADSKNFIFFDFEENVGLFENISQRSLGFIFLYDAQYDPNIGELTDLETEMVVS